MQWSTSNIPAMDAAGGSQRGGGGRRKLRFGSLAFASCLTVQCRLAAASLAGGVLIFAVFLAVGTVLLANPLRHFEIYLGQWSMSGPGRAFRIIPIFDGIGWAICINAIVRAIHCVVIAAIAVLYVTYSVKDDTLPFTYCRDFEFQTYTPIKKYVLQDVSSLILNYENTTHYDAFYDKAGLMMIKSHFGNIFSDYYRRLAPKLNATGAVLGRVWNVSNMDKIDTCNETFYGYPRVHRTPAYNFFYIEVMRLSSGFSFFKMNGPLLLWVLVIWLLIWGSMVMERVLNNRLIYNNIQLWIIAVPWAWTLLLLLVCGLNLVQVRRFPDFRVGGKEVLYGLSHGFQAALYIHSSGVGTEIIHGKGLNYFTTTHVDSKLNDENVWHSCLLLLLSLLQVGGVTACALLDCVQEQNHGSFNMHESIVWVLPMYSKCATLVNYSHIVTTLLFGGLAITYTVTAYTLMKTALHTIFEYKVKFVLYEQLIVAALVIMCMTISMVYGTNIGVALLESVDATMTGIATPLVCLLELIGLLYIYRSSDFVSDINVATEENNCGYRVGFQWKTIPFITGKLLSRTTFYFYNSSYFDWHNEYAEALNSCVPVKKEPVQLQEEKPRIVIILNILSLLEADMPAAFMSASALPLLLVVLAVPVRAAHNAFKFMRRRRPNR